MRRSLAAVGGLLSACVSAQALPLPGYNTLETHCMSRRDTAVDPIKNPGMTRSEHLHTHYGFQPLGTSSAKTIGDNAQALASGPDPIQNIPGGGRRMDVKDPGYGPLSTSCASYGDWAWYAIPTPTNNGEMGSNVRSFITWADPIRYPRTVGMLIATWAAPKGIEVYEPPTGMTAIVGNAHAHNEDEQDNEHVYWTCGSLYEGKARKPYDCTSMGGLVTGVVVFPNCWDGQAGYPNYDVLFGINRTHFTYANDKHECPDGSILITQLFAAFQFGDLDTHQPMKNPLLPDGNMKLAFASGAYYTFHADFGNLWSVSLGHLTAGCLNEQDYYGDFVKLTVLGRHRCNFGGVTITRCPRPTTDARLLAAGAPRDGWMICVDQD